MSEPTLTEVVTSLTSNVLEITEKLAVWQGKVEKRLDTHSARITNIANMTEKADHAIEKRLDALEEKGKLIGPLVFGLEGKEEWKEVFWEAQDKWVEEECDSTSEYLAKLVVQERKRAEAAEKECALHKKQRDRLWEKDVSERHLSTQDKDRLRKQRDEARATVQDMLAALGEYRNKGPSHQCCVQAAERVARERDEARAENVELRALLVEIVHYEGGADCACQDPYLGERITAALADKEGNDG